MNKREIGSCYEEIAGEYLKENGYEIIEYNYRCKYGEIDIIAKKNCELVFIEVKYRKNDRFGSPFEAVDMKKQKVIMKTAKYYVMEKGIPQNTYIRFDVVGIIGSEIKIIKNAFGGM